MYTIMGLWLAEADYLTKMTLGWIIATPNLLKVRLVFFFLQNMAFVQGDPFKVRKNPKKCLWKCGLFA